MGSSSMKLVVVALILSLLLLGGFLAEAAGRINDDAAAATLAVTADKERRCVYQDKRCESTQECDSRCKSLGYPRGVCFIAVEYCCCRPKK
ncbi:hypothetical protein C5167_047791 [Papaver somniferum]|uniref:Knottin scorpion toxin-like domain-containing protein n=1 Tax=Papaver somniferum TaxID=3469 RepID=A0A4Y7LJY8_PAPSO|nr:hypothetical protein C5167_047790 [Papaver somniferum]RZC85012.1 hypothetical protein C5167_047791 [Papaver somniferum]